MKNTNRKGFTLIELLVVIAIIGLLSTMAVVSLNSARQKARDAKRVSDVKQISTLLSLAASELPDAILQCTAMGTACIDDQVTTAIVGARNSGGIDVTDPDLAAESPKFLDPTGTAACLAATVVPCQYSIVDASQDIENIQIRFMTEGVVGSLTADNTHTITTEGVMAD